MYRQFNKGTKNVFRAASLGNIPRNIGGVLDMRKYFQNISNLSSVHKVIVLADPQHSPLNLADFNINQELVNYDEKSIETKRTARSFHK
jgi:hypothetical protein